MDVASRLHGWRRRLGSNAVPLLIVALWAVATLPWLSLRSFIYEEGTNAVLARDILARGDLLHPALYGVPWIEKPSLLPWMIAGVGAVTGGVSEWTARAPAMLSVLATALMVQRLTRRYASAGASAFAGLAFLFSPMLLQKLAIAEPDSLISCLSFAAFAVWWGGAEHGRVSLLRWLGCGALLAVLAMAKGPQPVAYFALGVGGFTLLKRRWGDLPGLVLCGAIPVLASVAWGAAVYRPGAEHTWMGYMRVGIPPTPLSNLRTLGQLLLELLPALLLAPLAFGPWRKGPTEAPPVVLPLVLYSTLCTAVLLVWAGATGRYAMPIVPSIAVLGGLAWDLPDTGWRLSLRQGAGAVLVGLIVVQTLVAVFAPPLFSARYAQSRLTGQMIEAAVRSDPAPLYCASRGNNQPETNQLFYVRVPIRGLQPAALEAIAAPAWLELSTDELTTLLAARPDLKASRRVNTPYGPAITAVRLAPR